MIKKSKRTQICLGDSLVVILSKADGNAFNHHSITVSNALVAVILGRIGGGKLHAG